MITTVQPIRPPHSLQGAHVACRQGDPEFWFPASFTSAEGRVQAAAAAEVCETCPARRACLEQILAIEGGSGAHYRYGVYGGYTPDQRFGIHRARVRRAAAEAAAC